MIQNFRESWVEDVFNGVSSKKARAKLPAGLHEKAMFKLQLINIALDKEDLRVPPGNRLHQLQGNRSDELAMRINDQWRVVFRWDAKAKAFTDVLIEDYH